MLSQIVKKTSTKMTAVGRRHMSAGGHEHRVFEGDFSKGWVTGLTLFVTVGGVGVPIIALKFQNWKHGFPQQE